MTNTPVYQRIEQVRQRKGVTKTDIAKRCGHTVAWYHDISKGRRGISVEALQQIANALEVPACIFFKDDVSETLTEEGATK